MRGGNTRFKKGHISWLKGSKGIVKPNKGSFKKGQPSPKKGRKGFKGRKLSEEEKNKISERLKGKNLSLEPRRKLSEARLGKRPWNYGTAKPKIRKGRRAWNKGLGKVGRAYEADRIRHSQEYILWRMAVFKRDNWTCIWCAQKGNIHADHIKKFSDYPELRFAIDNGRILCEPCHKTTDTYGNKNPDRKYNDKR